MKISNFVLSRNTIDNRFKYGIKFVPEKVLNKYLDYMLVVLKKLNEKEDGFNLTFKKDKLFNNIQLSTNEFKTYINMLYDFYNSLGEEKNVEVEFITKNSKDKIILTSLNDDHIKVCSVKQNFDEEKRVFFILMKEELIDYITSLNAVYRENEIQRNLNGVSKGFIRKSERDALYLQTLYIWANQALDNKDIKAFELISSEIKKIKENL
ncbi:hypothetical protein SDC9_140803 [bioreactor metagenome]|uniref:Uncharacterized protein n=1 Tax=bioreactor metagenome TaxID=1076179 RepID=A0A645DYJ5_9ZZZZ|nr:hypothetical protein [Clostridium sp. BSD9I1]